MYASSITKSDHVTSTATLEFVEGPKHKRRPELTGTASEERMDNDSGDALDNMEYTKVQKKSKFHVEHIARIRGGGGRAVVIRGPPKCFPIFFSSSREVFFDWTSLCVDPANGRRFQAHCTRLREEKRYLEYLKLVENILVVAWEEYLAHGGSANGTYGGNSSSSSKPGLMATNTYAAGMDDTSEASSAIIKKQYGMAITERKYDEVVTKRARGGRKQFSLTSGGTNRDDDFIFAPSGDDSHVAPKSKEELKAFWRQLVLTANAFATLLLEANELPACLLVLQLAESWSGKDDVFSTAFRAELRSYTNFTFAHYFFRTQKSSACLSHCKKAISVCEKRGNAALVAAGYLKMSCAYFQRADFVSCHESLYKVLTMVEEGRLSMDEPNPEQLCIVAVAYHNLAVIQLKLMCPDAACKSSQNAQKIARLCLAYSNRWLPIFHWTHQVALDEIDYNLKQTAIIPSENMGTVEDLTKTM